MNNIEINVIELFKKSYKYILGISFSLGAVLVLFTYYLPTTYSASASILPSKESGNSSFNTFLQSAASGLQLGALGKTSQSVIFAQILRSKTIASKIIDTKIPDRLGVFPIGLSREKKIMIIKKSIEVDVDKAGLISFELKLSTKNFPSQQDKDSTKYYTAYLANFAISSMDEIIREKNSVTAKNTRAYIQEELNKYYQILDSSSMSMENFQAKNNVLSLDEQTKATITQIIDMSTELTKFETQLNLAKLEYDKNSPLIKTLQKQVDFLKTKINEVQKGQYLGNDDFSVSLNQVPKLTREYTNIFRSKKILEQVVLYLETQKHQEAITEEKNVPIVDVLDMATPPEDPVSPGKKAMLAIGLLLGFIFSSIYFIGKEYLYQKKMVLKATTE